MISRIWIHYLISDKTSIIEMFNVYKIKLEKQLDKKIYIVNLIMGMSFIVNVMKLVSMMVLLSIILRMWNCDSLHYA